MRFSFGSFLPLTALCQAHQCEASGCHIKLKHAYPALAGVATTSGRPGDLWRFPAPAPPAAWCPCPASVPTSVPLLSMRCACAEFACQHCYGAAAPAHGSGTSWPAMLVSKRLTRRGREDFRLAEESFVSESARQMLFTQLQTSAESGWDFSSRWLMPGAGQAGPGKRRVGGAQTGAQPRLETRGRGRGSPTANSAAI